MLRPAKIARAKRLILNPNYPGRHILQVSVDKAITKVSFPVPLPGGRAQRPPGTLSRACPGCGGKIPSENTMCYECEMGQ